VGVDVSNINTEQLRRSPAVMGLLLVNVAMFIAQTVNPGVVDALGIAGEPNEFLTRPWTLVTVFFLHGNVGHLVLMLGMLLVFGMRLETITRARHVVLVYLAGGLAGSVAIFAAGAIVGADAMLGSSAAMFAIAAAFAVLRPDAKLLGSPAKIWAALLLLVNLPFAFMSLLASVAHIAGLAVGAAIGHRLRAVAVTHEAVEQEPVQRVSV
jgi:membrane associated rhomboid family serine protease